MGRSNVSSSIFAGLSSPNMEYQHISSRVSGERSGRVALSVGMYCEPGRLACRPPFWNSAPRQSACGTELERARAFFVVVGEMYTDNRPREGRPMPVDEVGLGNEQHRSAAPLDRIIMCVGAVILAEGAITLSVTLSGGALFAS